MCEKIQFQALTFHNKDIEDEFTIFVNGMTERGESLSLKVKRFRPFFYVAIPDKFQKVWCSVHSNSLLRYVKEQLRESSNHIVGFQLVQKMKIFPFTNKKQFKFIQIRFSSAKAYYKCRSLFRRELKILSLSSQKLKFGLFASNVDLVVKWLHQQNILPGGWVDIQSFKETEPFARTKLQFECKATDVQPLPEKMDISPLKVLAWDIECQSSKGFPEFPDADNAGDFISQIGCVLWTLTSPPTKELFCFTSLRSNESVKGKIVQCMGEAHLLQRLCEWIIEIDPDILTGFNTWGFDDLYIYKRMRHNNINPSTMSRLIDFDTELVERKLVSGAYGDNQFHILECPGRETLDLLIAIRREYKLESYKLNNVGKHFGQGEKEDMPYKELFEILSRGDTDPVNMERVCSYCMQDSLLVINLIEKLCILPNNIEMAKSTRVPMSWLLLKGQQCKVYSQLVYESNLRNYLIPSDEKKKQEGEKEKFKGATVLTAHRGAYYEPVAGLDFKSLYPSIMIAYNMCYSTLVIDEKYMRIKGLEYETVRWEEEGKAYAFTFVQNIKGLLPDILDKLWKERNATKREMKKHKGSFYAQILNGKQLAIKVTMNSVYGFTGALNGFFPCKAIAASVTAKGRQIIALTSKSAQELYLCETVYGDSVPGTQSVLVKVYGVVKKVDIEDLYNELEHSPFTEFLQKNGKMNLLLRPSQKYMAWTHKGWKELYRVIRHRTSKRMYRIRTNKGTVTVTEDHSLIDENGICVQPSSLRIGSKLLWKHEIE